MDRVHHLNSSMVVHSLDMKTDLFRSYEKGKNYLVMNYHIFVLLLVHLCILLTVLAQILLFLSIY